MQREGKLGLGFMLQPKLKLLLPDYWEVKTTSDSCLLWTRHFHFSTFSLQLDELEVQNVSQNDSLGV